MCRGRDRDNVNSSLPIPSPRFPSSLLPFPPALVCVQLGAATRSYTPHTRLRRPLFFPSSSSSSSRGGALLLLLLLRCCCCHYLNAAALVLMERAQQQQTTYGTRTKAHVARAPTRTQHSGTRRRTCPSMRAPFVRCTAASRCA